MHVRRIAAGAVTLSIMLLGAGCAGDDLEGSGSDESGDKGSVSISGQDFGEVQIVAAWSVDRLGRSLPDLVSFLSDIQAKGCDLYLHQQAIDTSTPRSSAVGMLVTTRAPATRSMKP